MSYRRRTYRAKRVRQNPKYSGFFSNGIIPTKLDQNGTCHTAITLVQNLTNQGSFAPPVQKIKHLKVNVHVPRITNQQLSYMDIDLFLVYLPQGSFNLYSAQQLNQQQIQQGPLDTFNNLLGNVVQNHPEWIMARSSAAPSTMDITKITLNARVNRNLNTGDSIMLLASSKSNITPDQHGLFWNETVLPFNIYYSYYSRSN